MSKEVVFGNDALVRMERGLNIAADAVKLSIGSRGRNAFIDDTMQPKITNDGVTIAKSIVLEDKFENMGAYVVKNAAAQTNDEAGDGTSTTSVLVQSIVAEARKRPENPAEIRKDLERVGARIVAEIKAAAKPVEDSQIESVATISAESPELGKMIADLFAKGGKNIPVTIDDNKYGTTIESSITEGLEMRYGYAHPLFINNEKEGVAEYEQGHVFVTDRKIGALTDLKVLMEELQAANAPNLIIVCSDIDNATLGQIVVAKARGQINALVVKVNISNDLEDIAAACGATIISEKGGLKLSDARLEHLGVVQKFTAFEKKLVIVNKSPKTTEYVEFLRIQANNEQNYYDKKSLNTRADRLEGGVALIRVGAHSDTEREYLKHKIEDAVNATKSALEEGLVEGGGMALYRLSNRLKGGSVGEVILKNALKAPLKAIVENAGGDYVAIASRITKKKGYDASKDKMVDMFKAGIVDPAKVTRCALQNALSSAGTFITSGVAIAELPKKE